MIRSSTLTFFFSGFVFLVLSLRAHPIDITDTTVEIFEGIVKSKINIPLERIQKSFGGGAEVGMTTSQKRSQILSYINERVIFFEGENALSPSTMTLHFLKSPGEELPYLEVRSTIPYNEHNELRLRNTLFFETSTLQKNLITIYSKNGQNRQISTVSEYLFTLVKKSVPVTSSSEASSSVSTSSDKNKALSHEPAKFLWVPFINMGIHHILIGWDHIAFLMGIILIVNRLKSLFWIITSFTIAHSFTLFLASTGILALPAMLTESMIALTIVWIGIENLFLKSSNGRWKMTFFLGLIHGVGFANTLETSGISGWNLFATILSFNMGVEIGQLLIITFIFPTLILVSRRKSMHQMLIKYGSSGLIILGVYWFLQRVGLSF